MDAQLKAALQRVQQLPDNVGFNAYAKTYARAALHNPYTGKEMEGDELKTQLLYVLNNLTYWRGEEARQAKSLLKKFAGVKQD